MKGEILYLFLIAHHKTFCINPYRIQVWIDYRLSWNPTKYENIKSVRFAGGENQIWRPDILLYNRSFLGEGFNTILSMISISLRFVCHQQDNQLSNFKQTHFLLKQIKSVLKRGRISFLLIWADAFLFSIFSFTSDIFYSCHMIVLIF